MRGHIAVPRVGNISAFVGSLSADGHHPCCKVFFVLMSVGKFHRV